MMFLALARRGRSKLDPVDICECGCTDFIRKVEGLVCVQCRHFFDYELVYSPKPSEGQVVKR